MNNIIYLFAIASIFSCTNKKSVIAQDPKAIEIINYIDSLDGFSGAVLIAKDDSILIQKAYGYANIGHKVKNNINTKFSYASIGKSFTAVAIFQLMQEGKLALDNPIGKFLPNYPNKVVRDSVTIAHLLQHRSGIANYFGSEEFLNTSKDQYRTIESITALFEDKPLESKIDKHFAYRNSNYIVLGRIIEAITNTTYDEYIRENIYSVAKIKNTGNFDIDHGIENAAENYMLSGVYPNELQKTMFMSAVKGGPAGGGYSNLNDLYNFATAFKNNQLLNSEFTHLMKSTPKFGSYGYGLQFAGEKDSGIYGHSGGHFGVGAEWRIFDKQNYTVVLLSNKDLGQGFLDARFFIQKTIGGTTPKLDAYFLTKNLVKTCLEMGFKPAKNLIENSTMDFSEIDLNAKGYEMITRGFYEKAIDLFRLQVYAFQESYNAYDSLAEAYMMNGNINKAIESYKKSLELNPKNTNAEEKLQELQK